jgi:beta-1,4-mannooligosaccharide/beta-1,4-mannosyl-N-acetylglucosamine phosphorylase
MPILTRHPSPILTAEDVPYPASLVFNAGVVKYNGQYVCVFRNDVAESPGVPTFVETNLGLATSDDGIHWQVKPAPCITADAARQLVCDFYPGRDAEQELRRFYDPRLTVIDGRVLMCFAVDTRHGLRGGMAWTDDFDSWDVVHLSAPDNRNFVAFPEKIGGDYVRLERPFNDYGGANMNAGKFSVWLSRSSDLRRWGDTRLVLGADEVPFANDKIGPAAPPVRTDEGWLTTFHGVHVDPSLGKRGWEPKWTKTYYAGLMLLDLDDPSKVVAMAKEPLLSPETPEECEGFRNDVIFPGGMILEDDGEVKIYYGAADTVECLATAHVDDLVRFCLEGA